MRLLDVRDPDIVEELANEILGFARPGDRIVVPPAQAPGPALAQPPAAVSSADSCHVQRHGAGWPCQARFLYGFVLKIPLSAKGRAPRTMVRPNGQQTVPPFSREQELPPIARCC